MIKSSILSHLNLSYVNLPPEFLIYTPFRMSEALWKSPEGHCLARAQADADNRFVLHDTLLAALCPIVLEDLLALGRDGVGLLLLAAFHSGYALRDEAMRIAEAARPKAHSSGYPADLLAVKFAAYLSGTLRGERWYGSFSPIPDSLENVALDETIDPDGFTASLGFVSFHLLVNRITCSCLFTFGCSCVSLSCCSCCRTSPRHWCRCCQE